MSTWREAVLYEPLPPSDRGPEGSRLMCLLCPFGCALADGQRGRCHVRMRRGDRMVTSTFASAVTHLDAIERKPFYHYRPGTSALTLAPGGCTFTCDYCVNHRVSQLGRDPSARVDAKPVDAAAVVREAASHGACVALSYSEPSLAPELTLALADAGHAAGVDVVWKTNGFLTRHAADLIGPHLAAANVDVKAVDDRDHRRLTGAPAAPVVDTISRLREHGVWVEVSTPLIPGVSAEPAALRAIARAVAEIDPDIPWHLLRFTPVYRMSDADPTSPASLAAAREIGFEAGLRYCYVERALGEEGRNTLCRGCGTVVLERAVWGVTANHLTDGRCPACGGILPGRWRR
jgi:pyruvate formate lyase activating enzyme